MKNIVVFIFLTALSFFTYADIYMKKDNAGNLIYSDMPMKNSETITVTDETITTNSNTASQKEDNKQKATEVTAAERLPYTKFKIESPKNEETLQNQPSLNVSFTIEPKLYQDDKIQIILDGKKIGKPIANTNINAGRADRGAHELYGLIVDQNNKSIKQSNVITIYVQQAHIGAKKKRIQSNN